MSNRSFEYSGRSPHVIFAPGSRSRLAEQAKKLDCGTLIVLATPEQQDIAEEMHGHLGSASAGIFAKATMHTPVHVTEQAMQELRDRKAGGILAVGGGSTIGLGKALKLRSRLPYIALPTTYAGSEVTPILGETSGGEKTTIRDHSLMPDIVIYDPDLTTSLPVSMSIVSGINAIAHAAEGLYAADRNPISSIAAVEGIRALRTALPVIKSSPQDEKGRADALYGAWLCGSVLGSVGMALHHKICHVLGGSFDLPHAETHAIMLPHSISYNADAATETLAPLRELFGERIAGGLYDFAASLGAPLALRNFGLTERDLDKASDLAVRNPYLNPRPIERGAIREMLQNAWEGNRPE